MVRLGVNLEKRDFVWIGLIVVLIGVGFVVAEWDSAKAMFHDSVDVKITIDGMDYSLQNASDLGLMGGGNVNSQQVSKTTASSTSSTSYVDLPGMSMDVTTSGGNLLIMFNTMARSFNGGETFVRILIDGVEKAIGGSGHTVQGKGSDTISVNWLETSLSAGTYNIKMQWKVYDQTSYIPQSNMGSMATATLIAVEL